MELQKKQQLWKEYCKHINMKSLWDTDGDMKYKLGNYMHVMRVIDGKTPLADIMDNRLQTYFLHWQDDMFEKLNKLCRK